MASVSASQTLKCKNRKNAKDRAINSSKTKMDKEVLDRLPYWVREMLRMMEEAKRIKVKQV